jgi:hypothetical protein
MSRVPQAEQELRGVRSLLMIAILTLGSIYLLVNHTPPISRAHGLWSSITVGIRLILWGGFHPHGNPLVYSLAVSWLIAITIATLTSRIFYRANPKLFTLARWEKQGAIYGRTGIWAFRWVLFHSPLGWLNQNFYLRASRADWGGLLRETNSGEAVHWLTCIVSVMLAITYLLHDDAVYGYVMLLVRIPFDLYPIMLQRWNRGRVWRVLERAESVRSANFKAAHF